MECKGKRVVGNLKFSMNEILETWKFYSVYITYTRVSRAKILRACLFASFDRLFSPSFGFPDLIPRCLPLERSHDIYLPACTLFLFSFFFYCPPGKLFTTGRIMKYYRCRCVLRKSLRNRALRNVIPGRVNGRRE